MTVLFLPGIGPEETHVDGLGPVVVFPVFEPTPAAAFVQLAAGRTDHRLFAERLVDQGREQPATSASPGVAMPVTGPSTQVWSPRLGRVSDAEPGRWQFRPSRNLRARSEVVDCPGEIAWSDRTGARLMRVRVSCPGPVQLDFEPPVVVPGTAGLVRAPDGPVRLELNQVGTWLWREDERWWAVSLGVKRIGEGRVVWHREGPVPDAVFGPADWIGLRDGELDIHMQAAFIRGALRSLFAMIARRPAPWTIAAVHPLADLRLALEQAPGSWEESLLGEAVVEVLQFVRARRAAGHRVALAGIGPVVPVTRVLPKEALEGVEASAVLPGDASVLFLWEDTGTARRRRLEADLARLGLTPDRGHHLSRVPGGYRLDLPPGTILGRCDEKSGCVPRDFRGHWVTAPWLTGWFRPPGDLAEPTVRLLSALLRHLLQNVRAGKPRDPFNE